MELIIDESAICTNNAIDNILNLQYEYNLWKKSIEYSTNGVHLIWGDSPN